MCGLVLTIAEGSPTSKQNQMLTGKVMAIKKTEQNLKKHAPISDEPVSWPRWYLTPSSRQSTGSIVVIVISTTEKGAGDSDRSVN